MRIQLIAKPDQRMTGLWRYTETVMRHLTRQGVDVRLGFATPPIPKQVAQLGRWLGWDLVTFLQSYPVWGRFGPADLYHLTSESLATLLMFQKIRPCVVTVHALLSYLLRDDPELSIYNHLFDRWFDALAVRGLHRAQAIIAVSEYVRTALIEQVGIAGERIYVVPEAVDHAFFKPQEVSDDFREKHGLYKDRRYVLYVGSEQPRKNFLTLLRAFARLRRRISDVCLLKVGQPEVNRERDRALRLIRQLGIEGDVIFCGHVGQDLPAFYNVAHLFVFPSRYEGFGFPPLEAMACGTPVVCSNTTSLPEVVGDAALLFDPLDEDKLVELMECMLSSDELREEYAHRGIERARRFHWDVVAQRTVEVYREVISQYPGHSH